MPSQDLQMQSRTLMIESRRWKSELTTQNPTQTTHFQAQKS